MHLVFFCFSLIFYGSIEALYPGGGALECPGGGATYPGGGGASEESLKVKDTFTSRTGKKERKIIFIRSSSFLVPTATEQQKMIRKCIPFLFFPQKKNDTLIPLLFSSFFESHPNFHAQRRKKKMFLK